MSIISGLTDKFLQFLDQNDLNLKISEWHNRREWAIVRKNTIGPYLLSLMCREGDNGEINIQWSWGISFDHVKRLGLISLVLMNYMAFVYANKNTRFVFNRNSSLFQAHDSNADIQHYIDGRCFLCESTEKTNCDVCEIINHPDTFFDVEHNYEDFVKRYARLYDVLLRKTTHDIKTLKNVFCLVKEVMTHPYGHDNQHGVIEVGKNHVEYRWTHTNDNSWSWKDTIVDKIVYTGTDLNIKSDLQLIVDHLDECTRGGKLRLDNHYQACRIFEV
jgi:hypothetical protein